MFGKKDGIQFSILIRQTSMNAAYKDLRMITYKCLKTYHSRLHTDNMTKKNCLAEKESI